MSKVNYEKMLIDAVRAGAKSSVSGQTAVTALIQSENYESLCRAQTEATAMDEVISERMKEQANEGEKTSACTTHRSTLATYISRGNTLTEGEGEDTRPLKLSFKKVRKDGTPPNPPKDMIEALANDGKTWLFLTPGKVKKELTLEEKLTELLMSADDQKHAMDSLRRASRKALDHDVEFKALAVVEDMKPKQAEASEAA